MIYWLIGQPGCGKTTLAKALTKKFKSLGINTIHVDGDELRVINDNAYDPEHFTMGYRKSQTRFLQRWLEYIENQDVTIIVSTVNPYRDVREEMKSRGRTVEILVINSGEHVRMERNVTDFELPLQDFIEIDNAGKSIEESTKELMEKIKNNIFDHTEKHCKTFC